MEPVVLIKQGDPENKPQLYACPQCGRAHSPLIYLASEQEAHRQAYEAAKNCLSCRTHNLCRGCGKEIDKHVMLCRDCRLDSILNKTERVTIGNDDPCFGVRDNEFYPTVEEARDAGCQWVHPATFYPVHIDVNWLLDRILDEHDEGLGESSFNNSGELADAVEKFNQAQTAGSYEPRTDQVAEIG